MSNLECRNYRTGQVAIAMRVWSRVLRLLRSQHSGYSVFSPHSYWSVVRALSGGSRKDLVLRLHCLRSALKSHRARTRSGLHYHEVSYHLDYSGEVGYSCWPFSYPQGQGTVSTAFQLSWEGEWRNTTVSLLVRNRK